MNTLTVVPNVMKRNFLIRLYKHFIFAIIVLRSNAAAKNSFDGACIAKGIFG